MLNWFQSSANIGINTSSREEAPLGVLILYIPYLYFPACLFFDSPFAIYLKVLHTCICVSISRNVLHGIGSLSIRKLSKTSPSEVTSPREFRI